MDEPGVRRLTRLLWPDGDHPGGPQVHWLLDGARDPRIAGLLRSGKLEYACLFDGRLDPRLQAAAPHLVHLAAGSPTTNRLLALGWGKAWGILTVAPAHVTLTQQRLHLKKLLRVKDENGRELVFRYYDPRVLRAYLPTCTGAEARTVFGPLTRLVAEDGDGLRTFELDGESLRTIRHSLAGAPAHHGHLQSQK